MAKNCAKRYFEQASVISNEYAGADSYCITLRLNNPAGFCGTENSAADSRRPGAGCFYMLSLKESSRMLPRPLSLYSFDEQRGELSFLYRRAGGGTEELSSYGNGYKLYVHGPLGRGFSVPGAPSAPGARFIIAGGGIGLAPLNLLVKEILAANTGARILFIAGGKNREIGALIDFFNLPPEVEVLLCTDDGSAGKKGFVPDVLADYLKTAGGRDSGISMLYACGPNIMLEKTASLANEYGLPCQISLERRMACGSAACMGCSIKTRNGMKKVCADGPVFDADLFKGMENIG